MSSMRANVLVGGFYLGLLAGTAHATDLTTERVATGLSRPVFVTAPPGDTDRLFIVEQRGSGGVAGRGDIRILNLDTGTINPTPFLSVTGLATGSEQGLLGLAFAPDYGTSGEFYVNYTASAGGVTRIARGTVSSDPDVADPSLTTLLSVSQPFSNHNGGWIGFGPEGLLYIGSGDGGSGGDPGDRAQDPDELLGKILRIEVSGGGGYSIPLDNPFVGTNGADEIWASGLRNPWRNSFDRVTGDLWIADVGQNAWEEIDVEPAGTGGGLNYGWRCREGAHPFTGSTTNPCGSCASPQCPLTDPLHEYSHGGTPFRCSITGGYVYRGCAIPDLRGTYFFADYCSDQIWSFRFDGATVSQFQDRTAQLAPPVGSISSISSFGEDEQGELYICDLNGGEVFKIVPDGPSGAPTPNDYDNDGDVDLDDLARFVGCLGAPDVAYGDCLCEVFDSDGDGDIDLGDFAGLQIGFTN